ncbi:CaiB/BaiF CoA transferase family protein [Noviherbaspirillum sedimenti]|uniref:Carnitine dehydratase n=1 Tax=Noviherbaspirillum sedimenti TaxID=2320865 RepID=A0A3A3FWT8_9BURK|nr:CoA transferase [Noviherbaspirillum sedimenti]RJG00607.1 hypothetical protein D3878_02625 [Noviherbaspirillum sedimenti]
MNRMTSTHAARPPLEGIRVLDLSFFTPGPFASQILADLGATIIKVEAPPEGDRERYIMPSYFKAYNRGKYSVVLNLKDPADLAKCLELAKEAHVVIEGFRPGVVERLGVDFETIAKLNPEIIYASISAYGSKGKYAQARAHDPEIQAMTGQLHYAKDASGKPYYNFAYPTSDYAAAMYAVIGILSWVHKPNHGPVHVEAPMAAAALAWMYPQYLNAIEDGNRDFADNNLWRGSYRTSDNRYITLTPAEGLVELAKVLGVEGITGRSKEEMGRIADAIALRHSEEVVPLLLKAGVPVGLVQTADEAIADPGLLSLGMLEFAPDNMTCGSPILGMPTLHLRDVPQLDGHGVQIRTGGWSAIEKNQETTK